MKHVLMITDILFQGFMRRVGSKGLNGIRMPSYIRAGRGGLEENYYINDRHFYGRN